MVGGDAAPAQCHKPNFRAKEACITCRSRKVRCDVCFLGAPCTNCVHAGLNCLLHKKKHQRKGIVPATNIYPPNERSTKQRPEFTPTDATPVEQASHSGSMADDFTSSFTGSRHRSSSILEERGDGNHVDLSIPEFVFWHAEKFSTAQREHFSRAGALSLPDMTVLSLLLETYIDWVHPQLPFLDLSRFLSAISSNGQTSQLSALLLHAVLFAGVLYVDVEDPVLTELGGNPRDLKNTLRARAKVLYEAGYEQDRLSLMQASLLLSLDNYIEVEVNHDSKFWLDISLMTFRDCTALQPDRELWDPPSRRLWWSLYVVTNTMAFREGNHGAPEFRSRAMGTPSIAKFGSLVNTKVTWPNLPDNSFLKQPYLQKLLAEIFIHRLRLQNLISKIMEEAAALGLNRETIGQSVAGERQKHRQDFARLFSRWDSELDKWWCGLPDYASDLKSGFHSGDTMPSRLLSFHVAVTGTEFFGICNAIYNLLMKIEDPSSFSILAVKHKKSMNSAKLLDIISAMDERDLPRYLLNHGLVMVEWALQQSLSSSYLSTASKEVSKLLLLVKKILDIRVATGRDSNPLTRLMKSPAKDSRAAAGSSPGSPGVFSPLMDQDREITTEIRVESPCSALPSSSEASIPSETPIDCGNTTEDLDALFSSCNGYALDDDLMSPCDDIDWFKA
ncbi:hypothetical protein AYO21_08676 [Fonsecaea monophora]|uniref:Zn(2)-C6 fungal-type domain-containing protein n=1 Tax=Fonsecaea monophora TaxID=254056 RepID=A0A177F0L3_9EURO|nr:hypothetical protein AYO21_08676 [Fonsecaea monophora]OAG37141.1 hypothetical protein AYO21_08676 [Fonsecaea monophora]